MKGKKEEWKVYDGDRIVYMGNREACESFLSYQSVISSTQH